MGSEVVRAMNSRDPRVPIGGNFFHNLVAFKWLMAGVGWRVDLSRLQRDKAYVDECLLRAQGSDSDVLRRRSRELLGLQRNSDA